MIKNTFLAFLISSSLALFNVALAETSVLLLGDSLSASYGMQQNVGWVSLLNAQLAENKASYKITNASISGETTGGGLARFPKILTSTKFDYLIIELGGNDGLRGFPPKLIKNNLLQIVQLAKEQNIPVAIMNIQIPPNYGARYNKLFTNVFTQVAEEKNIPLLPFFMDDIAIKPELMQKDGIHPNEKAQLMIAEFVNKEIKDKLLNE